MGHLYSVQDITLPFGGETMLKKVGRKVRSDKKRDVKPSISVELKDAIYRLSYITSTPVKDVCEALCRNAITNKRIMDEISNYFRRNIRINNTLYFGSPDNPRIYTKKMANKSERISLRLDQEMYEFMYSLSYALDCSVSRAVAVLLYRGIHDVTFINDYINKYLTSIDLRRKKELQKILDYINEGLDEEITLASLLSYIVDEFKEPLKSTKDAINDFIQHWKK